MLQAILATLPGCDAVCGGGSGYSRPGFWEAHGQQHVQGGPMLDGAQAGLALPPRGHFGVQVLFSCHNSRLHRYVRPLTALLSAVRNSATDFLHSGEAGADAAG